MPNYPPVEVGDTITIGLHDSRGEVQPTRVKAVTIAGPKATPAAVVWKEIGGDNTGHIPYETWQKAAAAQLAIAARNGPIGPDDPGMTQKLLSALERIGELTSTVARLESIQQNYATNIIRDAAVDMRAIKEIVEESTGKTYKVKPV